MGVVLLEATAAFTVFLSAWIIRWRNKLLNKPVNAM
jgi:hypothetical protein